MMEQVTIDKEFLEQMLQKIESLTKQVEALTKKIDDLDCDIYQTKGIVLDIGEKLRIV